MAKYKYTDEELAIGSQGGNENFRKLLIARYKKVVLWLVSRHVHDDFLREDMCQEALLGFMRAIDTFSSTVGTQFNTYATVCVDNALKSALRKQKQYFRERSYEDKDVLDMDEMAIPGGEDALFSTSVAQDIREVLAQRLSELEYDALFYRAEGYSYKEIAEMLGCDVRAVGNALTRANKKARAILS
ncbi:MAG: sigma-70 family RNA polymerase sigma factor [Coriobacteriia bacterium]|nr:sigma-70 family RNA polymerase sigma factor [Coriobacteriia bacterium]